MSRYISESLRIQVTKRANYCCEYCLIPEIETYLGCEVDHIISLKHEGTTELDNLAFACVYCNRNKGSDVGSVLMPDKTFIRFYNPRIDVWKEHFELKEGVIAPLTDIAKATIKILDINHPDRILERQLLMDTGDYPPAHLF